MERELDKDGIPKEPKHYNMQCEAGVFEGNIQVHVPFEHKRVVYPEFGTVGQNKEPAGDQ